MIPLAMLTALTAGTLAAFLAAVVLRIEQPLPRGFSTTPSEGGRIDRYLRRLAYDLDEAGFVGMSPVRFTFYAIIAGVAFSVVVISILGYALVAGTVSVLLSTVWIRKRFIGDRARANREHTSMKASQAAREIASQLDSGSSAMEALRSIAERGRPGGIDEQTTGRPNRAAYAIAAALREAESGPTIEDAMRNAAAGLANQAFVEVTEAFVLNSRESTKTLALALRRTAEGIDSRIRLRDKRRTLLRENVNSVRTMGYVIAFLVLLMNAMLPSGHVFYASTFGQIFLIVGAGIWYTGYRLISASSEGGDQ